GTPSAPSASATGASAATRSDSVMHPDDLVAPEPVREQIDDLRDVASLEVTQRRVLTDVDDPVSAGLDHARISINCAVRARAQRDNRPGSVLMKRQMSPIWAVV